MKERDSCNARDPILIDASAYHMREHQLIFLISWIHQRHVPVLWADTQAIPSTICTPFSIANLTQIVHQGKNKCSFVKMARVCEEAFFNFPFKITAFLSIYGTATLCGKKLRKRVFWPNKQWNIRKAVLWHRVPFGEKKKTMFGGKIQVIRTTSFSRFSKQSLQNLLFRLKTSIFHCNLKMVRNWHLN